ncbi:MAG: MFS transporter [Myxococcales bacterium]|nr:MFS transporter [Myxococcales bacterium]
MARPTRAPLFLPLNLPFGIAVGYATITTPFVLDKLGFLAMIATAAQQTGQLPHTLKLLWIPAMDARFRRRSWYIASVVIAAIALAATALVDAKAHLSLYTALLFAANVGAATSSAALEGLIATTVPTEHKGAAAGWFNAGNLGGTGIGGAVALWLTQHQSPALTAGVLAVLTLVCGLPILFVDEPVRVAHPMLSAIGNLARDLYRTAVSYEGWTGLVICLSPVGTGAAANLFSGAMHNDYGVSEHRVEVVTGLLGGLVSAAGCLFGGYFADLMNRRLAYAASGAIMAVIAVAMALGPTTVGWFTYGTLAYQFTSGIAYATFSAFVLEMIGHEGAVSTKYTLFVAAANWAISYTAILDGWGYERGRVRGLFLTDAAATAVGIVVLVAMVLWTRRRPADRALKDPAAGP